MKTQININQSLFPALSRIFTPVVMDSLIKKGKSDYLTEVCRNIGLFPYIDFSESLGNFFDWIYRILFKNYRNEYIYKNAIANKILLGVHNLNTSHMLTEFRVGKCKADVVVLNGTSTVYEIKSEYDSFVRLEQQINAYLKIFDNINVITSPAQVSKLENILSDSVGILVLTDRNTISTKRKSKSNKSEIITAILFDSLRKQEYTKIIRDFYGKIPDVPNTQIYRECKKLFCAIPPEHAHDLSIKVLKERSNLKVLKEFINEAPSSLSAYAMSISDDKNKMQVLKSRFDTKISSILTIK